MTFAQIQKEVESLTPDFQKKLMGFLALLDLRRDNAEELRNRIEDRSPDSWIPLVEAKRRLQAEP